MPLVIYNGSPRGKASNSSIISKWFLDGYKDHAQTHYIGHIKNQDKGLIAYQEASEILFIFPLYVDGMPGQVKTFFEELAALGPSPKKVTYIIHSGFSEGIQNRALEKYLIAFTKRMGYDHGGVIILPGSEGFRLMPDKMTRKKKDLVMSLAAAFSNNQVYDQGLLKALAKREKMKTLDLLLYRFMQVVGLANLYWNSQLKKHGAFDKRYDKPYEVLDDAFSNI